MRADPGSLVIASHRRSGTHLTLDFLRNNVAGARREAYRNLDQSLPAHARHVPVDRLLAPGFGLVLYKTHAAGDPRAFYRSVDGSADALCRLLDDAPVIYVHRDGRDVLVSQYHYERRFSAAVRKMDFSTYLRSPHRLDPDPGDRAVDRPSYWAFHVQSWLSRPGVATTSFEAWHSDPEAALGRLARTLGLRRRARFHDVRQAAPRGWVDRLRHAARRRVLRRTTAVDFRRGERDGWRRVFSEDDRRFFEERAGQTRQRLGYAE